MCKLTIWNIFAWLVLNYLISVELSDTPSCIVDLYMSWLRLRFFLVPLIKSGLVSCSSYVLVWVRCFWCDFSTKFYFNHGYLSVKILVTLVAMVRLSIMSRKCLVEVCNSDSLVIEVVVDSLLLRVLILGVVVWCVLWGKVEPLFRDTLLSQTINLVSSVF